MGRGFLISVGDLRQRNRKFPLTVSRLGVAGLVRRRVRRNFGVNHDF